MKKLFGRFKDRASGSDVHSSSATARRTIDVSPQIIIASARSLVEGIEQILFDSGTLSGDDMSGFHKLIDLIDSKPLSEEIHIISGSRGVGCISILLKYALHMSFIDCCGQANLAPALLHALRLLRMMEVKAGKPPIQQQQDSEQSSTAPSILVDAKSVTVSATERVCKLLVVLCGSTQIMEQLRPSLSKLLCLPLSPLPLSGVHFQENVANIIYSICKSGLTSPIIWALRDSQTILQMTRALRELTSISDATTKASHPEILLKGLNAEEKGMWVVATSCIVEILNAADSFSPVLMTDFESSGGFDLIVHICLHSSVTRSMQILNSVIILLVGDATDKPLLHPHVGVVLERILRSVLSLPQGCITGEECVQDLMKLCITIVSNADGVNKMDYILQNISYSLLTLYSSHPHNYVLLETVHFLLPMLTLCLPALKAREPFSAVLKVLDFVCSERCDLICVKSVCASVSMLSKNSIASFLTENNSSEFNSFLQCISFSEEVICRDKDYSQVFFKHGIEPIFYDTFSQLSNHPDCGRNDGACLVYKRQMDMLVNVMNRHHLVCEEVVRSGLNDLASTMISSVKIDYVLTDILLQLQEQLAITHHSQYECVMQDLVEAMLSLSKSGAGCHKNMRKIKVIIDVVGRILTYNVDGAPTVWSSVHGFESLINVIESFEGLFSSSDSPTFCVEELDSQNRIIDEGYMCLQSIIECIAQALNARPADGNENRIYFRQMIKYPKLADCLYKTNILSSSFSGNCVSLLFKLVSGCDSAGKTYDLLVNPDAFALLIDILPYLPHDLALSTIQKLKAFAFSQIDGCQVLSEAGLIRVLIQKYHVALRDISHPLHVELFDLLQSLCGRYLTSIDFQYLFQYLVRPDAIPTECECQLLPVWKMEDLSGTISESPWKSLQMINSLTESPSLASSAAHILLGSDAVPKVIAEGNNSQRSTNNPAHLHMQWSESQMGKSFPVSSFSFTSWLQLGTATREGVAGFQSTEGASGTISIFSIRSEGGNYFELQFDTLSSNARYISCVKGSKVQHHAFSIPYVDEDKWHLIVVTLKKQKKIIKAARVGFELFFDGQLIHSEKLDAEMVPLHGPVVDIFVGKSLVVDSHYDTCDASLNLWHLGPVLLFDDALSQIQISRIMSKGANYTGNFQGESPLDGSLSTRVTEVLRRCNSTFLDLDELLSSLGLEGLDQFVFSPFSENCKGSMLTVFEDLPSLPTPIMAYNANSSFVLISNGKLSPKRIGLHNTATDFSISPHAELVRGWYFSRMDSVSRCISALGGPSMLLPLIQGASTEDQLVNALNLIGSCLLNESSNLNYMHDKGFGVLSFLLSRKQKALITDKVFNSLFGMAVDRGLKSANSSVFSILLVDTLAMNYLILNHQIWDPIIPENSMLIMSNLKSLVCEDARHGLLNSKRMALLGVCRWVVLFLAYIMEECDKDSSYYSKEFMRKLKSSSTTGKHSTENAFSTVQSLVQSSVYIIRALMLTILFREDIDLISSLILICISKDMTSDFSLSNMTHDYIRVSLLRTVREVYVCHSDKKSTQLGRSNGISVFCSHFTPEWFFTVLDKAADSVTVSQSLLLLSVLLQEEAQFRRAFCKHDTSLRNLQCILTPEDEELQYDLSVALPLIALLFQIPVKLLPSPQDATLDILNILMERCDGPLLSEPDLKDFTIPVLSIVFTYYSHGARTHASSRVSPPVANVIFSGMLKKSMMTTEFNNMRDLMQQRESVEILANSIFLCSNAGDDYGIGTRLLSCDDGNEISDLSQCIQEDYISVDNIDTVRNENEAQCNSDFMSRTSNRDADCQLTELDLIVVEGRVLVEILEIVFRNAILKYSNPHIVCQFFLSFPNHIKESFICGYQSLLMEAAKTVLQSVFEEMEVDALQAVCDVFSLLIPVAKAGIFHKSVLYELLQICLYGLDAVASPEASNWLGLEKHSLFLRDIGSSARYYSMLNFQKTMNSAEDWKEKLSIIQTVRSHLHLLCLPSFDDVSDPAMLKSRRDTDLDKVSGAVSVLESFNINVNSDMESSKKLESVLQTIVNEKCRSSLVFCLFFLLSAYSLFLDDEKKIRNEALRICAALLIHRQQFMSDVLCLQNCRPLVDTDENENSSGPDLYEGFMKLVPNTVGGTTMYSKLLRRVKTNFEDESKRIAEFSFWLTDNGSCCDRLFGSLDLSNVVVSPTHLFSTANSIKDMICEKAKIASFRANDGVQIKFLSSKVVRAHIDIIFEEKRQWLLCGVAEVSGGALNWKSIWLNQQSCPIWGNAPSTSQNAVFALGGNEESNELTYTPLELNGEASGRMFTVGKCSSDTTWKLSSIAGPEKVCRRLEQDFFMSPESVPNDEIEGGERRSSQPDYESSCLGNDKDNSENCNDEESNIEDFLISIAANPLVRKVSSKNDCQDDSNSEFNLDIENAIEEETSKDVNLNLEVERDSVIDDRMSDMDDAYISDDDGLLVEIPDDYESANDHSHKFSFRKFASSIAGKRRGDAHVEQLTANQIDPVVLRRGRFLLEILRGILGPKEFEMGHTLNVYRINGLEAKRALFILTPQFVHIIDGFQMNTHPSQSELIPFVWHEIVSHTKVKKAVVLTPAEVVAAAVRQKDLADEAAINERSRSKSISSRKTFISECDSDEASWLTKMWYQLLHADYGHFKMPLSKVYTIFKRRYELENKALELTDVHGNSLLFAYESTHECDNSLKKLIEMNMPLSIFKKVGIKKLQLAGGGLFVYKRVTNYFLTSVTKLWQSGSITNFDYLMHLNTIAGRSFQDLTQYPVFPWVLADYESKSLDFTNSRTFRDLSKPMGAIGKKRSLQYEERYKTMEEFYNDEVEEATPPYFYGTHYSCAGYVLYYMMRIQPYARMAKTLQGGHFDTADRLFKAVHHSWISASQENLQDVRELIPEFYYLPEFLKNTNNFDFGETQKGDVVNDVQLPPWAGGDPCEFIRRNRAALESKYVSEHLHLWIDLIFGYRQRGPAARSALNLFMPLTYSGEVDLNSIEDPILRAATISQINNFGQTPSRLFLKPHPKRHIPDVIKTISGQDGVAYSIDSGGVLWHERMTPPLNVVGKSSIFWVSRISYHTVAYPNNLKSGSPVGDIRLIGRDRLVAVPKGCILLPPRFNKFIRYGKSGGGVSIHNVHNPSTRSSVITNLDSTTKEILIHEQLHPRMISCISTTKDGDMIATGGTDRSVRVWRLEKKVLVHHASFLGHSGTILTLDISASFSLVISGSDDRTAIVWDCGAQPKLLHVLDGHKGPVLSVSINPICGYIATLTSYELRVYSINGILLSSVNFLDTITRMNNSKPTFKLKGKVVLAPPAGEWQEDAVLAVTGHETGHILLWKLTTVVGENEQCAGDIIQRNLVPFLLRQTHSAAITSIKLCPSTTSKSSSFILKAFDGENNYEMLVGDADGFISRWAPAKLDSMSPSELFEAVESGKLRNVK